MKVEINKYYRTRHQCLSAGSVSETYRPKYAGDWKDSLHEIVVLDGKRVAVPVKKVEVGK